MTTLNLEWGGDFSLTPGGSLVLATGWDEIRQRIVRRMLTNSAEELPDGSQTPADYIFDQSYGLGGGALVSQNPTSQWMASFEQRARGAVLADAAVDPTYPPAVVVQQRQGSSIWIIVGVRLLGETTARAIAVVSN